MRYGQLRGLGVGKATICRWIEDGYLHRELPRVYAVGHRGASVESGLSAALLYAGPAAMLSHGTAVWWLGLLDYPPAKIQVSTPRRVQSLRNVIVHGGRRVERTRYRGFPVTSASRTIVDFAACAAPDRLRLALANADYHGLLDLPALDAITGRGITGSAALEEALAVHRPELAHTRSELERRLLSLCEQHHLRIPEFNVAIEGWLVDALWREERLIVEVDGLRGHRSRAQLERDHQRDLELRRAGYVVLRYTWRQVAEAPEVVATELVQLAGEL